MVVRLPLSGTYQLSNLEVAMALAIEAHRAGMTPPLKPDNVRSALEAVSWPGRLSVHLVEGREVTMDCAHNLEAVVALASYLDSFDHRYNLLFSCLDDKPVEAMARVLAPRVGSIAVCPLNDERAMPLDRLVAVFPNAGVAGSPRSALDLLEDPVLATGSVRLVGTLLALSEAGEVE
jgi:dihydrofolate synthase/folylpolyglutamate synthase